MAIVSQEIDPDEFYKRSFTLADKNKEGCLKRKNRDEKPVFLRRERIFLSSFFSFSLSHHKLSLQGFLTFLRPTASLLQRFMVILRLYTEIILLVNLHFIIFACTNRSFQLNVIFYKIIL